MKTGKEQKSGGRGSCRAAVLLILVLASARARAGSWQFSAGPVYRGGMELSIRGSSYVQTLGLHAASPRRFSSEPAPWPSSSFSCEAGPLSDDGYADRSFDDGFVFMDPGTADPQSIEPGLTWYWGYENGDQYDAAAQVLSFHRDGAVSETRRHVTTAAGRAVTVSPRYDRELSLKDDLDAAGLEWAAGYEVFSGPRFSLQWRFGFRGFWGISKRFEASTYGEEVCATRYERRTTYLVTDTCAYRDIYAYDTTGIEPPQPPYQGTYDGPGPVIPNTPASAEREILGSSREISRADRVHRVGSSDYRAENRVVFEMEADLYSLGIGPRLSADLGPFGLFAAPALTLNYLDGRVKRAEQFNAFYPDGSSRVLNAWEDRRSEGDWRLGAELVLGAEWRLGHGWSLSVQGGYDWVDGATRLDVGPNPVRFDARGYSAGVLLSRRFGGVVGRGATARFSTRPNAADQKPSSQTADLEGLLAPVRW